MDAMVWIFFNLTLFSTRGNNFSFCKKLCSCVLKCQKKLAFSNSQFLETIVISSTSLVAEGFVGVLLGEYVKAGEFQGQPYYEQRDTKSNKILDRLQPERLKTDFYLYSSDGTWVVSWKLGLGPDEAFFRGIGKGPVAPREKWEYWNKLEKKWKSDDVTLTADFKNLALDDYVDVEGVGDVVAKIGTSLGKYR